MNAEAIQSLANDLNAVGLKANFEILENEEGSPDLRGIIIGPIGPEAVGREYILAWNQDGTYHGCQIMEGDQ